ncbi:MAG: N-acetylmuramoyl-L-alanine amidase [Armatimonadetes bacterium]|nr:N-acetylmuramoyl-L-alanine amidase [Armatimonadota bacterium]
MRRLETLLCIGLACLCAFGAAASADTVGLRFYQQDQLRIVQREVPAGKNLVEAAVRGLVEGPTVEEKVLGYTSAIPSGTKVEGVALTSDGVEVGLSAQVLAGFDEAALQSIFDQFTATLGDFPKIRQIKLTRQGKPLSDYLAPAPVVGEAAPPLVEGVSTSGLATRKIAIGPSHGRFWNGSGWYWQRGDPCGFGEAVLEDTNSIRLMQFLYQYLTQDGAAVYSARELNESNCCNSYEGLPWWKMASYSWLRGQGYPCSVWASSSGNCGAETAVGRSSDDIRARPLFADYHGTDIYIAHHTNAGGGGTANGTETFRDTQMVYQAHVANSLNLANKVQSSVVNTIRSTFDGEDMWSDRGVKDSAGGFGEIRIPNRPAILIELAFHDACSRDAQYLTDNFFRSLTMWGIYKGICDYFGTTPTWDKYSLEYVSDTLPAAMETGHSYNVSITFRNRGVLWTEARQIRLGAVGDYDPFTPQTRQIISGEVRPGQTYTFNFTLTAPNSGGTYTTDWRMVRDGYQWFGPTVSKTYEVVGPPDTEAPSVPTGLFAESVGLNQVNISWNASTDNVGVIGYKLFRDGVQIADQPGRTFQDAGRAANTQYCYTVLAYDAVNNQSAQSAPYCAITHQVVWQDGFYDLNNWPADKVANGTFRGLETFDWDSHGTYPGDVCVATLTGTTSTQGSYAYRALAETYAAGSFDCFLADQAVSSSKQGLHIRGFNGSNEAYSAFVGCYPDSPMNGAKYAAGVFDGSSWSWAPQVQIRAIGWLNLRVEVGVNAVRAYYNGSLIGTLPKPAAADTFGLTRVNLGHPYNVNTEGYFDDAQFTAPPPVAPLPLAATPLSTESIRWNYADRSPIETGYLLLDGSQAQKGSAGKNSSSIAESGLAANTQYSRLLRGRNGTVLGPLSAGFSAYTLSVAPTSANVTCDRSPGTPYATPEFVFTAVGGFGAGKVQYYRYAWDQSPTHSWTGSEAQWSAGTLDLSAASPGDWYLHVKGFNGDGVENGALTLGPYQYEAATSTIAEIKALPDGSSAAVAGKVVTANFGSFFYIEEPDGSSGIRVNAGGPATGALASVSGTIQTVGGERVIASASVGSSGTGAIPAAALLKNLSLGGGSLNAYTPGVMDGLGANNLGLFVSVAGRVTHVGAGFCYVDDGSMQAQDGSGYPGVRVDTSSITAPAMGTYAVIEGISSTYAIGSENVRMLRATGKVSYTLP